MLRSLVYTLLSVATLASAKKSDYPQEVMKHGVGTFTMPSKVKDISRQKTLIFAHGGGGDAKEYMDKVTDGIFGHPDNLKIVFLQSHIRYENRRRDTTPWMRKTPGTKDPCKLRNNEDVNFSADAIAKIVEDEVRLYEGHNVKNAR